MTIFSERAKVRFAESGRSSWEVDLKLIDVEGEVMAEGEVVITL